MERKIINPPLKIQGKKTKLIGAIQEKAEMILDLHPEIDTWIEPFMGTGIVAFNSPKRIKKILCTDENPHVIRFYTAIQYGEITADIIREEMTRHGENLLNEGYSYYKKMKDEFNKTHEPMLFLFLSRTGFNGMMRFNKRGEWNLPYCKLDNRLNEKNVEMLANSVKELSDEFSKRDYTFFQMDYRTLFTKHTQENSLYYCDPPYLGLYTNYFSEWDEDKEAQLAEFLKDKNFILSTWSNNGVKDNEAIAKYWSNYHKFDMEHFYNVAAKAENRRTIVESLICNY